MGQKLYNETDGGGLKFVDGRRPWQVWIPCYVYDIWLPLLGATAVGVYGVYVRLARENVVKAKRLKDIATACRIGTSRLAKINKQLVDCGFIRIKKPMGHKRLMHWTTEITVLDPPPEVGSETVAKYWDNEEDDYESLCPWLVATENPNGLSGEPIQMLDEHPSGSSNVVPLGLESLEVDSLPAPPVQADEPELTYDYDDLDGEQAEQSQPQWSIPELPIHFQVLEMNKAKRFHKTRQKSRLTGLSKALAAWVILAKNTGGPRAYQATLEQLRVAEGEYVQEPLLPIPPSWIKFRLQSAKDHRWGTALIVRLLFSREALINHCNYHLKKLKVPVEKEYEEEEGWD